MRRLSGTVLLLLAATACAESSDETAIRDHERQLVLPEKADPLLRYDRYYAVAGKIATGRFIRSEGREGKLRLVATEKDIPFVADGGCGVIEVRLDLQKKAWERPFCHGQ